MSVPEDAYATQKRFWFVSEVVAARRPAHVLDLGCGTGIQLTYPLARAHPQTRFLGVDPDADSIAYARRECVAPNLEFAAHAGLQDDARFDLIIASEVIEHVEMPGKFLRDLRARLAQGGAIVLTVPNGYGPYEWASLAETLVASVGLLFRRQLRRPSPDTLAISPHINFFSWGDLRGLIAGAELDIDSYRARSFLCGFGFDHLLRGQRLIDWNARIADRLPAAMVSDWMLLLVPVASGRPGWEYRRGRYARLRRRLNEKRAGLR